MADLRAKEAIASPEPIVNVLLPGLLLINSTNDRSFSKMKADKARAHRHAAVTLVGAALHKPIGASKLPAWNLIGRGPQPQVGLPGRKKPPVDIDPLIVLIVRLSPRSLDHDDSINISGKHVRDGVADVLGIDDRDKRVTWRYGGEPCSEGRQGARVLIYRRKVCPCCDTFVSQHRAFEAP